MIKTEGIPLYVKIREALRAEITQGTLKPGDRVPSEDELAARCRASRMTVRQGIIELIDEGILYRRHGVGTFVAQLHVERDCTKLTNFFEMAEKEGIRAQARILCLESSPAKRKVANALRLQEGEPIIHLKTLRLANNVPMTVQDAYMPYKLFPDLLIDQVQCEHLWTFFERYGYRVKKAIQKIEARKADKELTRLLGVAAGAPILYKERTVYADDGTPIEFTYCFNRGDRYSLTISLSR